MCVGGWFYRTEGKMMELDISVRNPVRIRELSEERKDCQSCTNLQSGKWLNSDDRWKRRKNWKKTFFF